MSFLTKIKTAISLSQFWPKASKWAWIGLGAIILFPILFTFAVSSNFLGLFGGMPSLADIDNPKEDLSSQLITADGVTMGKYSGPNSNRLSVQYSDISQEMIKTILAAEDNRFYEHSGIDIKSVIRAAFGVVTFRNLGGGSTITQQLAKNLFKTRETKEGFFSHNIIIKKTKEWILAITLESRYTKQEILAMYLNTVFFGQGAYGLKVAANTYFNTDPKDLNYQQSAMLAGLVNLPSAYDPKRFPERAMGKRNRVLGQLELHGYIDEAKLDSLQKLPMGLDYKYAHHSEGLAPYFREVMRLWVSKWAKENGFNIYTDGLKIYTTIDSRMQVHAEKAVKEHMKFLQEKFDKHWEGRNPWIDENYKEIKTFIKSEMKNTDTYRRLVKMYGENSDSLKIMLNRKTDMKVFSWKGEVDSLMSYYDSLAYYKRFLRAGFMAMEPQTGHIKAWVGGIDHYHFKYDHVSQGKRQPGSTFKPFVYAAAIENGYSPCQEIPNEPVTFEQPGQIPPVYRPQNSTNEYDGQTMTLREALSRSINQITAYLMKELTAKTVVEKAHQLGIQSELDAVPALCLGVSPVSIKEMVGAYGTFANKGFWNEPIYISRIEDKNGNIIYVPPQQSIQALSEENAFIMCHMLQGAVQISGGSALGLGIDLIKDGDIGGKTGTTQNASDGWFMGVTPNLVAGAWVGGENQSIRFRTWTDGQGSRTSLPIYRKFMTSVYADKELKFKKARFPWPRRALPVEIDCDKYKTFPNKPDSVQDNRKGRLNVEDL